MVNAQHTAPIRIRWISWLLCRSFVVCFVLCSYFYRFCKIHSLDHVQHCKKKLVKAAPYNAHIERLWIAMHTLDQPIQCLSGEARPILSFRLVFGIHNVLGRTEDQHFLYLSIEQTRTAATIVRHLRIFVAISMKPQATTTEPTKQNKLTPNERAHILLPLCCANSSSSNNNEFTFGIKIEK